MVCDSGRGNSLCHKMQYFRECETRFLMPGQSEVMPGKMPECSYTTGCKQRKPKVG